MLPVMGMRGGIAVSAGALVLLTACTAPEPVASTTTSAVSPTKTTASPVPSSNAPNLGNGPGSQPPTTPQPPPPHSPDKVTSACPFLGVTEVSAAMGAALDAWAEEAEPYRQWTVPVYRCDYRSRVGGRQIHQLYVAAVPGTGRFTALLKLWTEDCAAPAATIAGVTGTARSCAATAPGKEGDIMVLVAKKSHGETRLAELDLRPQREEVYTKIAQLLTERL
jgi:hypothetical protein